MGEPAFDELDQQVDGAWWLALVLTADPKAAADAVAEGFMAAARDGIGGEHFHLQLLAAVRRAAAGHDADISALVAREPAKSSAVERFWRSSPHARAALWLTDAELLDAADVGVVLNLSAANAGYLAARTRDRIQPRHGAANQSRCPWTATLPAWLDGTLSASEAARVDDHIYECGDCVRTIESPDRPADLVSQIDASLPPPPVELALTLTKVSAG